MVLPSREEVRSWAKERGFRVGHYLRAKNIYINWGGGGGEFTKLILELCLLNYKFGKGKYISI